jgi:hypothetical protein
MASGGDRLSVSISVRVDRERIYVYTRCCREVNVVLGEATAGRPS